MVENWDKSFIQVLRHEGGYVNHPSDPGGRTNLGVTQTVWEEYIGHPVDEQVMRSLTVEAVNPLYKQKYWDKCRCDELPNGIDYLAFDFAVNAGPFRAIKTIQSSLNITADGVIGPITLKAICDTEPKTLITSFSNCKRHFYKGLNTFPVFGAGWLKRVEESKAFATGMLG
jgi:hypothetical protein